MSVQVSSSNKVVQTESPIGPGYYANLPTAFDNLRLVGALIFHSSSLETHESRCQD